MKTIGFAYEDKLTQFQHTRDREDILKMHDDYFEWLDHYREERYRIYYQDET